MNDILTLRFSQKYNRHNQKSSPYIFTQKTSAKWRESKQLSSLLDAIASISLQLKQEGRYTAIVAYLPVRI
jgi:hypothetical protein